MWHLGCIGLGAILRFLQRVYSRKDEPYPSNEFPYKTCHYHVKMSSLQVNHILIWMLLHEDSYQPRNKSLHIFWSVLLLSPPSFFLSLAFARPQQPRAWNRLSSFEIWERDKTWQQCHARSPLTSWSRYFRTKISDSVMKKKGTPDRRLIQWWNAHLLRTN